MFITSISSLSKAFYIHTFIEKKNMNKNMTPHFNQVFSTLSLKNLHIFIDSIALTKTLIKHFQSKCFLEHIISKYIVLFQYQYLNQFFFYISYRSIINNWIGHKFHIETCVLSNCLLLKNEVCLLKRKYTITVIFLFSKAFLPEKVEW